MWTKWKGLLQMGYGVVKWFTQTFTNTSEQILHRHIRWESIFLNLMDFLLRKIKFAFESNRNFKSVLSLSLSLSLSLYPFFCLFHTLCLCHSNQIGIDLKKLLINSKLKLKSKQNTIMPNVYITVEYKKSLKHFWKVFSGPLRK